MELSRVEEDLLRRFLVDRVTAEEREGIEARFQSEPEYFEAMCALEGELMLDHLRGRLPPGLQQDFRDKVLGEVSRRRHVEEMSALVESLERLNHDQPSHARDRSWWTPRRLGMVAAAAVLTVAVGTVSVFRREPPGASTESSTSGETGSESATRVESVMVLQPGVTRGEPGQTNVFVHAPGTTHASLRLHIPEVANRAITVELRRVGGEAEAVAVPSLPEIRSTAGNLDVRLSVPRELLPRGDYLLTVRARTQPEDTLATRFFTIDE